MVLLMLMELLRCNSVDARVNASVNANVTATVKVLHQP